MTRSARSSLLLASLACVALAPSGALAQRTVSVSNAAELTAAIQAAVAGDDIVLADGRYDLGNRVSTPSGGTMAMPIRVRAANRGGATVRFVSGGSTVEGFLVSRPFWSFEDLVVEGDCADDSRCEHAWHVVGNANGTVIRGNVARNFNAHIKGNGTDPGGGRVFPDNVLVEGNELYSDAVRMTSNPVTPIDVVGGRNWIVRANFIHDFAKGQGNGISYAAFLKGNSRNGILERNLVVCELMHTGRTRLGLSFGGGGTGPESVCEDGTCTPEHQNGVMRNNVIAHCPTDVGIYVNACRGCAVVHNTLFDTNGIDFRFPSTAVMAEGNLHDGNMRDRDGASSARMNNLSGVSRTDFNAWFTNPNGFDFGLTDGAMFVDRAAVRADVPDDFCGNLRDDGMPDIGAVEYDGMGPCDTTRVHPGGPTMMGGDAGPMDLDAGPSGADAGPPSDSGMVAGDDGGGPQPGVDSGAPRDGGPSPTEDGCGCSSVGRPAGSAWVLVGLAALVWRRRRRGRE